VADRTGTCSAVTRQGRPCRASAGAGGKCPRHRRQGLPTPPRGLSETAEGLWWWVLAGEGADHDGYELDAHELGLLREAARTLSRCDELAGVLEAEGLTTTGSKGQTVAHPALAEVRQQQLAYGRLVAQLRLPEGEDDDGKASRPQRRGGPRRPYALEVVS
jgi:hypothetical protein